MADWPDSPARRCSMTATWGTPSIRSVFKGVLDEHMHVGATTLATRIFPDSSGARPLQGLMRA
jgi:uncharacterized protein (DUF1501 family)